MKRLTGAVIVPKNQVQNTAAVLAERVVRLEAALQEIATCCGGQAANIARRALGVKR